METVALYVLVSGVIQNCYLGSSQGRAELGFSSSTPRRAVPTGEGSALPLPSEEDGQGSGAAAPAGSASPWPRGATEDPSGTWDKGMAARNGSRRHSVSSGNGSGVRLSTPGDQGNATSSPLTTARQKSPPASDWLPVLEKEDIPVVVGVSVSLALILIAMGVYSFRQKREATKGQRTSPQSPSESRRRRRYLEVDMAHENRAFEVECAVDTVEQTRAPTSSSPSLPHADPTPPAETAGRREKPEDVAANETLQTAQARAVDAPLSLQHEPAHQEGHPHPLNTAPSSVPPQCSSARPRESGARAPAMCSTASPALQRLGTALCFHGLEPLLRSIGGEAGGNQGQVPAAGLVEGSPPGAQSRSGTARMSVTVEIHLCPEMCSAPAAARNVADSPRPEAASQPPASPGSPSM
ncbi:uncharacterized protein LOC102449439 [Pelodiscus sinensis]|uniref:uncharacterized protein LOC102449439 n=1 Tax=Pelodiscus sinensis TaxID=13735 RepID=UPI003F6CC64E